MADNVAITAGSGTTIAADDVGGVLYPRHKLSLGADGAATDALGGAGAVAAGVQRVTLASDDPLVTLQTNLSKAEDAAHSSGDKGTMALAVRKDTATALAGTDGDYIPLITDANGRLHVIFAGSFAEDAAHTDGDTGVQLLSVRKDTAAATSGTTGDYQPLITDANGRLHVIEPSATTLATAVFAEDAAHVSGDKGIPALAVRKDTATSLSGTDGDYNPLVTDSAGRLHCVLSSVTFAEDAAHTDQDKGVFVLSRRIDTPASSAGTTGDYATVNTDANGKLWVADPVTVISVTPTIDTAQFAAGDAVGGKQTLTSAVLVSGGLSTLASLTVVDKGNQKPVLDILFFDADPTVATITNNAAFVLSTDVSKVIARVSVAAADYQTIDSVAIAQVPIATLPPVILKANGSTSLFAAVILRSGTPTFLSAGDLIFKYGLAQK